MAELAIVYFVEICGFCHNLHIWASCEPGWLAERESYWLVGYGVMTNQQQLYWLRCSDTMGLHL